MSKITLSNLANLTNETTAVSTINANFATIQDAIDNLLSLDGTAPNSMGANLDMNSYRLQNLPYPGSSTEPVRLTDLDELMSGTVSPSKWYGSTGAPSGSSYEVSDWYLDTTTYDVYEKTAETTWTLRGNIKGATGATGPTGPAGAGTGDMLKSTYDTNDNGIVDAAASVPFSGITSKPTTLSGYGITDAQPLATKLTNFNALTWGANTFPYFTGTSTVVAGQLTAAGLALLDDADAAAQRTTLGLGTLSTKSTVTTGDITNGAATLAKLDTTGANGLVLTAQGAGVAPVWAAAGGGGASHTLLATITPTATTSMSSGALTLTGYRKLLINYTGIKLGTTTATFRIAGTVVTAVLSATTTSTSGYIEVELVSGIGIGYSRLSTSTTVTGGSYLFSITNSTTSIAFTPSTGSFQAGGTIKIYGVA